MDRYLLWTFIRPSHALVIAGLVGIAFHRRPLGRALLTGVVLLFAAAAILPLGALLSAPLEQRFMRPDSKAVPHGIIVLAGAESAALTTDYGDPQLNAAGDRLTTLLTLSSRFPTARLVHSGAGRRSQPDVVSQSDVAQALFLGAGIDADRILFENQSTNTCNAASAVMAAAAPQHDEQWWLVTSAFHMPRAMACFRAAGWPVIAYPTDYRYVRSPGFWPPDLTANLESIDLSVHEWLGLAYYRLSGQTDELFPAP